MIRKGTKDVESRFEQAESLYENKKYDEALKLFEELEPVWPDLSVSNYIGCCQLNLENFGTAESIFRKLIDESPDWEVPYYNLARVCMKTGRSEEAYGFLKRSMEINPENGDSYFYAGVFCMKKESWKKAVECFLKAERYNGEEVETWLNLTVCYDKIGEKEKALSAAELALKLAPSDPDALSNISVFLVRKEDYEKAFGILYDKKSVVFNDIGLLKILFNCALKLGKHGVCRETAERILSIDETDSVAKKYLTN